jgi:Ca-activated chloride channel homolog
MKRALAIILLLLCAPSVARADAGVLIPRGKSQPDPSILSLEEMTITIQIEDGDARVFVTQIFANRTGAIEEGDYVFALPSLATVSDFAVWDGPVRIPAVILERKRAGEIYNQLKQQAIDPGLLQMGERGAEEAKSSAVFSARIVPIPPFGTKRLEFEYHERIPVESLKSYFAIPLRPDAYAEQVARHLRIEFELHSAIAIANFQAAAKTFPLHYAQNTPNFVKADFAGQNINLAEDFVATYDASTSASDTARILAYRNPEGAQPSATETAPIRSANHAGFFEVEALLGGGNATAAAPAGNMSAKASATTSTTAAPAVRPKTTIILFDVSLSMQWEKLERSFEALETLLRSLKPQDSFNLILFNTQTRNFAPQPVAADATQIQRALDFVRASKLRGGTNLQAALDAGFEQCAQRAGSSADLVLISDGGATRGPIRNRRIAGDYANAWGKLPESQRPGTYVFGVGDDANAPLLRMLARNGGVFDQVLSTEPLEFKLNSFLSKIGRAPVGNLRMDAADSAETEMVYRLDDAVYPGSVAGWVGRYRQPAKNVKFTIRGERNGGPFQISESADLPARSLEHLQLPRLWARARVDALLEKIERQGEDEATIDEIIRLAREYKFVTPYTSFLAVPRALLRPRVIRPGDPVLRVKTNGTFASVVALLPFGLVEPLRYLPDEDVWETRFYVPDDMRDGTYPVRLILRDDTGRVYRETKTFVIASKPPVIRIHIAQTRFRRGETLNLSVSASASTRRLVARLEGAAPVELRWNSRAGADTGELVVPDQEIPGIYKLTVTGEDIAHNIGSQAVNVEILP